MAKSRIEPKGRRSRNPLLRYFQETQTELRKVTWPTREEAFRLSMIVLGFTAVAMIFLGALDFLFQRLASLLLF